MYSQSSCRRRLCDWRGSPPPVRSPRTAPATAPPQWLRWVGDRILTVGLVSHLTIETTVLAVTNSTWLWHFSGRTQQRGPPHHPHIRRPHHPCARSDAGQVLPLNTGNTISPATTHCDVTIDQVPAPLSPLIQLTTDSFQRCSSPILGSAEQPWTWTVTLNPFYTLGHGHTRLRIIECEDRKVNWNNLLKIWSVTFSSVDTLSIP